MAFINPGRAGTKSLLILAELVPDLLTKSICQYEEKLHKNAVDTVLWAVFIMTPPPP